MENSAAAASKQADPPAAAAAEPAAEKAPAAEKPAAAVAPPKFETAPVSSAAAAPAAEAAQKAPDGGEGPHVFSDERTAFVKNIPWAFDEDALKIAFQDCEPLESVRLVRDRLTGRSKVGINILTVF